MGNRTPTALLILFFISVPLMSQSDADPAFELSLGPMANIPMFGASGVLALGRAGHFSVRYAPFSIPLYAELVGAYSASGAIDQAAAISTASASLGAVYRYAVTPRIGLRGGLRAGYGYSTLLWNGERGSAWAPGWWVTAGADFMLTDSWLIGAQASLTAHSNSYVGLETGIGVTFRPGGVGTVTRERRQPVDTRPDPLVADEADGQPQDDDSLSPAVETVENTREDLQILDAGFEVVFPVFYRYYDSNPIGSATLRNQSNRTISDLTLIVNIPRFMDVAQRQSVPESLSPGEEVTIPISVLFNDGLLGVTEGTRVAGEFQVSYSIGGSDEAYVVDAPLNVADRNAMTWDDDRKAASFVTSKDPAVLTFARNVSSVVREVGFTTINTPLRTGMAMLEAMALQGINYVVDPTTPYIELSEQPFAIDFLQFPRQTFQFRAGDCDDLSICYAANLEAVGVAAAFITIPGHIFSAFSTGMSEAEARQVFARLDDLIIQDGVAWVPVETTLLQDGFMTAWKTGARQWREYSPRNEAGFYPIQSAWEVYEPIGFDQPSAAQVETPDSFRIRETYDRELQAFIDEQIGRRVAQLETRIRSTGDPRSINRLGVLYARFGLFEEATEQFLRALEQGPSADSLLNLGNLEFLKEKYDDAADYFQRAEALEPENPAVLLAVAKANHELQNYGISGRAYEELQASAPELAMEFEYLQFRGSDAGRASDAAEKRQMIIWGETE